jgi:hypothetical protein
MDTPAFPVIHLTVERMQHSMLHAFSQHQMDISAEVQRAIERECSPENIQRIVDEAARGAVKEAVTSAVKRWWATSEEGRKLIEAAIAERMDEEARIYGGRK